MVTAAQALLTAELDASQRQVKAAAGVRPEVQGRGMGLQVALARRESHHRGKQHLSLARIVATELPCTWEAWRAGQISEYQAMLIARETVFLSRDAGWLWMGRSSGVADGIAAYAALTIAADAAVATGDGRSRDQVMADTLVSRVAGRDTSLPAKPSGITWASASTSVAESAPMFGPNRSVPSRSLPIRLQLVMSDQALLGASDQAAHLDGYGLIPAELARELIANADDAEGKVWVRRLYTQPTTGELVGMDAKTRLFPAGLARFIRLRDQTCRTPWCDAPIRHLDHANEHVSGGPTSAVNGQGLCPACNHAKQAPGWRAGPAPGPDAGAIETTTPTGHQGCVTNLSPTCSRPN